MPSVPYRTNDLTRELNFAINKALGANMPAATIITTLQAQATALGAVTPAPQRDRTLRDTGKPLNPHQPFGG